MGTIDTGVGGFSWIDYFSNIGSVEKLIQTTGLQLPTGESEWLAKSDQEKVRDIFALMPPPPMMSMHTFQTIAVNFAANFSITRISSPDGSWKSFGPTETGITLAAVFEWAKGQNINSDLVKMLLGGVQKNPLEVGLAQFVSQTQIGAADIMRTQLHLRNVPVLTAVIRTVDPKLVLQAFKIAQQQLVLSILDKWVDQEAAFAKLQKELSIIKDLELQRTASLILKDFVEKATLSHTEISQSVLSVLMGSLLTSAVSVEASTMASPFVAALAGKEVPLSFLANVPRPVLAELGALSLGVLSATNTWATPLAMALCSTAEGSSLQQMSYDIAKSYAMTLCSFLMDPALESFISSRLEDAKKKGLIDEKTMILLLASFRDSLLINAMALLYKAETGGVTGAELLGIINGTIKIPEDNFLHTLAVLINESLKHLPPEEARRLVVELVTRYDLQLQLESITEPTSSFVSLWDKDLSPLTFTTSPA